MTALYHPRPERWPQVSLKGLLIAVTLAALLMPSVRREYERRMERESNRRFYEESLRQLNELEAIAAQH